jgi:outer membrane protein assembly factor BamE (lipoprotein component of BamABCDE complex)
MKSACYFSIVIAIILSGCATTVGNKFDDSKINKIKTGKSTKENVSSLMGTPYGRNTSADGTSIWTYQFIAQDSHMTAMSFVPIVGAIKGGETESSMQMLLVTFNKSGIVASCTYRTSSSKGSGMMGEMEAGLGHTGFGNGEVVAMNCEDVK